MKENNLKMCMITGPLPDSIVAADLVHVSSLIRLLEPLVEKIFVISRNFPESIFFNNNKIKIINIRHQSNSIRMFIIIPTFIIMQLKISYQLFKIRKEIDIVFFSIGAIGLFLPMLSAKFMRKKILLIHPGVDVVKVFTEIAYSDKLLGFGGKIYPRIINILEILNYYLSDKIIVYSQNINKYTTNRRINKKLVYGSRFLVDINSFKIEKKVSERMALIGYIGKFYDLKGILNFIDAVPIIMNGLNNVKFLVCGDGPLRSEIEMKINDFKMDKVVTITNWIPHEKLPQYLNEIKLLVIPSYTEVGPQLLFEAMACGTPVLAASVGVVPDIIIDGKTGFKMDNNSPECIAKNVIRALNCADLNKIMENARELIEKEHTFDAAEQRYKKILETV